MIPYFSICIPAYKNTAFLTRLLDSISIQTFKDFEVVITDNTPDNEVFDFLKLYNEKLPQIKYFKNEPPIGIVANWNESIKFARGKWIKLMHSDDWFADKDALEILHKATAQNLAASFFFTAFTNVEESDNSQHLVRCNKLQLFFLKLTPLHLFTKVYVGNPSCTLIRRDVPFDYDERFKFVVDFEFYIRCFKNGIRYEYVDANLINVGFHKEQLTTYTKLVPEVQVPENMILISILSDKILLNPFVFDYYWRLFRNLRIRSVAQLSSYYTNPISKRVLTLVRFQSKISTKILSFGPASKITMTFAYLWSTIKFIFVKD